MQAPEELLQCRVEDLGLINYDSAYLYQKELVATIIKGAQDTLLLCEHPTVFTLGRLAEEENILIPQEDATRKGFSFKKIDRGGDITLHSPGQLVIYPLLNLRRRGMYLKAYLTKLEEVIIDLLRGFGIVATRFVGQTGVWVENKKIASIGIGVRRWVSFHGMAINVNNDLKLFDMIRPCGLDVTMISLAQIKRTKIDMHEVKERAIQSFSEVFNLCIVER